MGIEAGWAARMSERRIGGQETTVTKLLEQALSKVEKLPASEQDAVAAIVIEELASEQRWSESFAKSQEVLAKLGEKALAEHAAGLTKPL